MTTQQRRQQARAGMLAPRLRQVLAATAFVQVLLALLQATLAGHLLTGSVGARTAHEHVATGIMWTAAIQIVLGVLLWRPSRGPAWPLSVTAALFGLLLMQLTWGYGGRLALHVPTGVLFLAAQLVFAMRLIGRPPSRARLRPTDG